MSETNKEAWTGGKNISQEAMEKRKSINKKILKFGCLPIVIIFLLIGIIGSLSDKSKKSDKPQIVYNDPLKIGKDSLEAMVGKSLPTEKWKSWGEPETLEGTDNRYWIIYLKNANVSMISQKSNDTVIFADFEKQSATNYIAEMQKEHKELVEKQFNAWDGSHPGLTKLIKKAMNDPDSYEHDETVYWDMTDYLVVLTTYRGKNAFGALVKNYVKAKVDFDGNVIEIIDEGQ